MDRQAQSAAGALSAAITKGTIDAHGLVTGYCCHLYDIYGTYEAVARRTGLDRRTVKKYIQAWRAKAGGTGTAS